MKKLHNIFDENYPKSKFDKAMNGVKFLVSVIGMLFFLLVIAYIIKQNTSIVFYNKINPIAVFLQNHGVNFRVIWIDCSPYIVAWFIFAFVPLVMWSANNYKRSLRDEYLVKTTSKLIALNNEIDEQKAANKILRESNMKRFEYSIELKKSFADAVSEIKKLVAENKLLESCNQDNLKLITHWRERALHQKHTKKVVVEATEWKCISDDDYYPNFKQDKTYKATTSHVNINKETTLCLISESDVPCLVEKVYFTPVKET